MTRYRQSYHCMGRQRGGAFGIRLSPRCLLDDADLLLCQAVELVDQLVDLFVRCGDLALDGGLLVADCKKTKAGSAVGTHELRLHSLGTSP